MRRLTAPTLVIWGQRDPTGPVEAAQAVVRLIPNAQLTVLPGGHVPWLGNPGPVADLLSRFVRADGKS